VSRPERRANPRVRRLIVSEADTDARIGADTGRRAETAYAGCRTDAEPGRVSDPNSNPDANANSAMRRTGCGSRGTGGAMPAGGSVSAGGSVTSGTECECARRRAEQSQTADHQSYAC
jgi:hypothetical protein